MCLGRTFREEAQEREREREERERRRERERERELERESDFDRFLDADFRGVALRRLYGPLL